MVGIGPLSKILAVKLILEPLRQACGQKGDYLYQKHFAVDLAKFTEWTAKKWMRYNIARTIYALVQHFGLHFSRLQSQYIYQDSKL